MNRMVAIILVALSAAAVVRAQPAPASEWEIRYAQLPDQTEEWTRMGRIPAWEISFGEDRQEVHIGGDEEGRFRGIVLLGRRWRVPDPLPEALTASLEYQTFCEIDRPDMLRSGTVSLELLTLEQWDALARRPEEARIRESDGSAWIAVAPVHAQGEDVTQWRAWESNDLAAPLRPYVGREVVIAITWAAYHFDEEWARFRGLALTAKSEAEMMREFLESFDPHYPGLEAYAAAMERGDLEAAKRAIVEHMRTRTEPPGPPLVEATGAEIERAEEILDHVFRLVGTPPTDIGETIQWNEDPHNYDQWPIALNRHVHWRTLGRAYLATGDERYAREFVAQLNSWIDAMPVNIGRHYVEGPYFVAGRAPLTLDAGIRMAQSWWPAYYYFRNSPSFDVESQFRMLRSFARHAEYLMNEAHFHLTSNWGAMEANGLYHIGVMLPEMLPAKQWRETATERLVAAMEAQVYPDGAQIELTPGYHGVTLGNFLGSLDLARRTGAELPESFVAGLERMFIYYVAIAMPDGRTPALNDSSWGGVAGWMERGLELFPQRGEFEYVLTSGASGQRPERTSWRLPYAGFNVMRTGWAPDDSYLLMETGPFGRAHQHEDKLGLICYAAGHRLLTEAGTYSYDASEWRRYVLSTRAHNTVMVDGMEQNRRALPETRVSDAPAPGRWHSDAEFDFAEGFYDSGYGEDNATRVRHTRRVLFVKPGTRRQGYWVIADLMVPEDGAEHTYEALFHLDAQVAVDPVTRTVSASFPGGQANLLSAGGREHEVEIVEGQTEPVVQGWLPTGRHNELRPVPTAVVRWQGAGPSAILHVISPAASGTKPEIVGIEALRCGEGTVAVALTRSDGGTDVFATSHAGETIELRGERADGDVLLRRYDADGALKSIFALGARELSG